SMVNFVYYEIVDSNNGEVYAFHGRHLFITNGKNHGTICALESWEAILHYYLFEYYQDDLVVILLNSVSDSKSITGFNIDVIPDVKDAVRIDVVGDFTLQKVTPERSYFRCGARHECDSIITRPGVQVGHTFLSLSTDASQQGDRKETIIDSGTTLAYLPEAIYEPLVFKGNFWCIGWQNSRTQSRDNKNMTLLGDLVLSNKLVIYNLKSQVIGWTEYNLRNERTATVHLVGSHYISTNRAVASMTKNDQLSKVLEEPLYVRVHQALYSSNSGPNTMEREDLT
ncbi:hypothetical protein HN873_036465, partial [Arachis hypogaea]